MKLFCSTAPTSTGWVRMTIKPRHCPHTLSNAAVIKSKQFFPFTQNNSENNLRKNLGLLRIEPGPGVKSERYLCVLPTPLFVHCLLLMHLFAVSLPCV